jgi:hypothetical protein
VKSLTQFWQTKSKPDWIALAFKETSNAPRFARRRIWVGMQLAYNIKANEIWVFHLRVKDINRAPRSKLRDR